MNWLRAVEVAGSGIRAASVRMSVIAENLANAEATRTPEGGPYQRQVVLLSSTPVQDTWPSIMSEQGFRGTELEGVQVTGIVLAQQPTKLVYDPSHPDADAEGYVEMPNVDVPLEMADLTVANRVYQANVAALQTIRRSLNEAIDLLS